jgi:hypothetical protein
MCQGKVKFCVKYSFCLTDLLKIGSRHMWNIFTKYFK